MDYPSNWSSMSPNAKQDWRKENDPEGFNAIEATKDDLDILIEKMQKGGFSLEEKSLVLYALVAAKDSHEAGTLDVDTYGTKFRDYVQGLKITR